MIAKIHFFILIAIGFCQLTLGQNKVSLTFELRWNDQSTVQTTLGSTITIPLVEGQLFDENYLPKFRRTIQLQNNKIIKDYQIKNVKMSVIETRFLDQVKKEHIEQTNRP